MTGQVDRDRARAWLWKRAAKAARADRATLREEVQRLEESVRVLTRAGEESSARESGLRARLKVAERDLERAQADLAEARADLDATEAELLALHDAADRAELEAESEVES